MKKVSRVFIMATALFALWAAQAAAATAQEQFDAEEIKPFLKIMEGPWVNNVVSGGGGAYRLTAKMPRDAKYVIGLFDHKVGRAGKDQRSAVVLVDGVNPLAPAERVAPGAVDSTDVSWMRKVPFDGLTFNSRDGSGRDCTVKVVDAKEEYEFGPIKPFAVPMGRAGSLGRIDILVYAGPAAPPNPGEVVQYGKPLAAFAMILSE